MAQHRDEVHAVLRDLRAAFQRREEGTLSTDEREAGSDAEIAILQTAFSSQNDEVRKNAVLFVDQLSRLRPYSAHAPWLPPLDVPSRSIPLLINAINDPCKDVRLGALKPVIRFGAAGRSAIPLLITWLSSHDPETCRLGVVRLGEFGQVARQAIPNLIGLLHRDDIHPLLPTETAQALGRIGPAAVAAVPNLLPYLSRADEYGRWPPKPDVVAEALGAIGGAGIAALSSALQQDDPELRRIAAMALAKTKNPTRAAIPALASARQDSCSEVRRMAAQALVNIAIRIPLELFALVDQDMLREYFVVASLYRAGAVKSFKDVDRALNGVDSFNTITSFAKCYGWKKEDADRLNLSEGTIRRRRGAWARTFQVLLGRPIEVFVVEPTDADVHNPQAMNRLTDDGISILEDLELYFRGLAGQVAD